ncbi:hypothetical protein [Bradyrhizobium sp.]|uniref:hypothetical protein n=1 Tax=Bradyrhizobium sp. TaxID=376 RepID=UPI002D1FBD8C|nr:hypothetical protein [Bradyrhizobium sp.]
MGHGNIDVGSATATRKAGQPAVEELSASDRSEPRIDPFMKTGHQGRRPAQPASVSGAMSQQGGEFRGNVSAPQQFVHLVGCRDHKDGRGPEASQNPNRGKR